jgi:hypothetical protein
MDIETAKHKLIKEIVRFRMNHFHIDLLQQANRAHRPVGGMVNREPGLGLFFALEIA